jgi:integrase/recombinase XerD
MAGKQAKALSGTDLSKILKVVRYGRYPERDRAMVLLSVKAGLRACEIAGLTWAMVLDPDGGFGTLLEVRDGISKRGRGRTVPLNNELRQALLELYHFASPDREDAIIESERGGHMCPMAIVNWFARLYAKVGLAGCSSHSGRRTFITNAARVVHKAGGSLRDVQQLAGHASISMTQRYIDGHAPAKRAIVNLI